jgi:hypothetical protein
MIAGAVRLPMPLLKLVKHEDGDQCHYTATQHVVVANPMLQSCRDYAACVYP